MPPLYKRLGGLENTRQNDKSYAAGVNSSSVSVKGGSRTGARVLTYPAGTNDELGLVRISGALRPRNNACKGVTLHRYTNYVTRCDHRDSTITVCYHACEENSCFAFVFVGVAFATCPSLTLVPTEWQSLAGRCVETEQ